MSTVPLPPTPAQLDRYLAGDCTPEAARAIEQWLDANPAERAVLHGLRDGMRRPRGPLPSFDTEARVAAIVAESVGSRAAMARSRVAPPSRVAPWLLGIGAAAALVVAGWAIRAPRPTNVAPAREMATVRGQLATFQLGDGTSVTLGPDSRVRFRVENGVRRADVDGAAFFSVEPDRRSPFLVRAGHASARVLGTGFGVRWYPRDAAPRISVVSGRVAVRDTAAAAAPIVLAANDVAGVTADGRVVVRHDADLAAEVGWRTGQRVFRNVPASAVAADLGRAYDLDIRIDDPALAAQPLTLSFATDQQHVMLDILVSALLDARMTRRGGVVHITRLPH